MLPRAHSVTQAELVLTEILSQHPSAGLPGVSQHGWHLWGLLPHRLLWIKVESALGPLGMPFEGSLADQ